jgi:hypothetical protein
MEGYARAGALAEEAILGVRTVAANNGQSTMVRKYKNELDGGRKYGIQKALWSGLLTGIFFLVLYIFLGVGM